MRTHVSRVYPAALIDLYDREVIGYMVSNHMGPFDGG